MSEELKPCEHGRNFCMDCHYPKGKFKTLPAMYDGLAAENQRLRTELAALKAGQGEAVAPYGYLREVDGNVQLSIGALRPADRSGGRGGEYVLASDYDRDTQALKERLSDRALDQMRQLEELIECQTERDALRAQAVPEGYVLVPVELLERLIKCYEDGMSIYGECEELRALLAQSE